MSRDSVWRNTSGRPVEPPAGTMCGQEHAPHPARGAIRPHRTSFVLRSEISSWDRPGLPACTASGAFLILRTYTFHASADAYSCHTESRRFDLSSAVCLFRRQILRRAVPFVLACPDAVVSGRLVVFAILLLCTAPGSPSLFVLLCCDILPRAASPFLFYSIVIYCPGQPLPFCFPLL